MKGIGLFGGTFNPIHLGHLQVAQDVMTAFDLGKIIFIPSAMPPHKDSKGLAAAQTRYAMILNALASYPDFAASDVEIYRQGPSYTIDTIAYFQSHRPRGAVIYWIVGADAFLEITTWKNWKTLFDWIPFIVMTRPGVTPIEELLTEVEIYIHAQVDKGYEYLSRQHGFIHKTKQPIYLTRVTPVDISSSTIRDRLHQGTSIQGLVPDGVNDYIQDKGLYQ